MNPASILIVDDDPINHAVLEAILEDQGYALHYALSGQEAIDTLAAVAPDLILLDVMMPGISGTETCRRIKAVPAWQSIPIVMVTALSSKEDLGQCIAAGAEDFLSKPVNPVELRARVHSMLRIKQQYDNIKALTDLQANTIEVLQDSLQALRRNLAASLPHELNTPLQGISGILELLLSPDDGLDAEETRRFLALAQASARRLEKFISRFLIYFELEIAASGHAAPRSRLSPSPLNARPVLQDCARAQAEKARRAADLVVSAEDVETRARAGDLRFIVEELLENAFKFSAPGTAVSVSLGLDGGGVALSVCDQGRGMTPEQIDKIGAFMQFERKQYEQQGSGLGLAIVNKIAAALGGSFSIESVYHQGTRIRVRLPGAG